MSKRMLIVAMVVSVTSGSVFADLLFSEDFADAPSWYTRSEARDLSGLVWLSDGTVHAANNGGYGYIWYDADFGQEMEDIALDLESVLYWAGSTTTHVELNIFEDASLSNHLGTISRTGSGPNNWLYFSDTINLSGSYTGLTIRVLAQTASTNYTSRVDEVQISGTPVPEPSTMALLSLGGFVIFRRRK